RLGFLGLFAERISAFTRHGRIDDAFVLCGIGGEAPSIATEQALRTVLARLCVQSGNPKAPASSPGQKTPSGAPPGSKSPSSAPPGSKS
ncbi:MAG TPA: hypothetical protein VLC09_21495, partial [Polyangiaceae bacterium]|nr:hypothetical protein [Polyangiaceae bacterium]